MLNDTPDLNALQDFLGDAHQLLGRGQECMQHFRLIGEDADASYCLIHTLASLRDKAQACKQMQIAGFCEQLCAVLDPVAHRNQLHGPALEILEACLCLLAWQVELMRGDTSLLTGERTTDEMCLGNVLVTPSLD